MTISIAYLIQENKKRQDVSMFDARYNGSSV